MMKLTLVQNGKMLKAKVEERLDTAASPAFEKEISAQLEGITLLVLDLEKLEYISSSGLRALLSLQKKMNKQGKMTVRRANESVMEVFEITGFADILTIENA